MSSTFHPFWSKLVERYAKGRAICNCREAYLTPCGEGIVAGERRTDIPACAAGCSANKINCKEEIARRVLEELDNGPYTTGS